MQQNDLPALSRDSGSSPAPDDNIDHFVRRNLGLPIVGIDLQADREITEVLGDLHRRDFLRRGRFRVAEIGRPEKPGRAPRQRLDQPLCRIQLDARHAVGRFADIGVGEGVIAEIVPFRQHALHEPRIGRAVLSDDEEGRVDALRLQDIEDFGRPFGAWAIVEGERELARNLPAAADHEGGGHLCIGFPDDGGVRARPP